MRTMKQYQWHPSLLDPTGQRAEKPRLSGKTMIMDKGLGWNAFEDMLETAAPHVDMIKIGFGTSPLYPHHVIKQKIEAAKARQISIYPGGTFLEVAVANDLVDEYFQTVSSLGFTGVEISDGTIELDRSMRSRLILKGLDAGLTVYTEYGKKCWGSTIEMKALSQTVAMDIRLGADLVTIEGRESGMGVGIFDKNGDCKDEQVFEVLAHIPNRHLLLWEAPQKAQQVHLIRMLGSEINLGNINPQEILALEALRRGLRADTFIFPNRPKVDEIYELNYDI
ncbi:MAG: phosphosulfolactate synthase [Paenibacillaceae bacterium]